MLAQLFFHIKTNDVNGIKLGRREIFVEPLISNSFFSEVERLYLAKLHGFRIIFAPVKFIKRSSGKEHGANLKNLIRTIYDMIRYIFLRPKQPQITKP